MSDLIQLVYASRACFPRQSRADGIEPEVARILVKSRSNNTRDGVVGVLHYADGAFLQCLEGPRDIVHGIMQRVRTDPRHEEVQTLREQAIAAPSFAAWSMKFVPADNTVRDLLRSAGLRSFEPHRFDAQTLERFLDLLRSAAGGHTGAAQASASASASTTLPAATAGASTSGLRGPWLLASAAMVLSTLALVLSITALLR